MASHVNKLCPNGPRLGLILIPSTYWLWVLSPGNPTLYGYAKHPYLNAVRFFVQSHCGGTINEQIWKFDGQQIAGMWQGEVWGWAAHSAPGYLQPTMCHWFVIKSSTFQQPPANLVASRETFDKHWTALSLMPSWQTPLHTYCPCIVIFSLLAWVNDLHRFWKSVSSTIVGMCAFNYFVRPGL